MVTRDVINGLNKTRNELTNELQKINNAIHSLQQICKHEWLYDWHDSHYSYFKCKHCDLEESR